jgi:hypothetical protein
MKIDCAIRVQCYGKFFENGFGLRAFCGPDVRDAEYREDGQQKIKRSVRHLYGIEHKQWVRIAAGRCDGG